MFKELYRLGRFVKENKALLRSRLAEPDAAVGSLYEERLLSEGMFRQVRRGRRTRLHNGRLDDRVYRQLLVRARKNAATRQQEIRRLEEGFFKTGFPTIVPVSARDEILAILWSPV